MNPEDTNDDTFDLGDDSRERLFDDDFGPKLSPDQERIEWPSAIDDDDPDSIWSIKPTGSLAPDSVAEPDEDDEPDDEDAADEPDDDAPDDSDEDDLDEADDDEVVVADEPGEARAIEEPDDEPEFADDEEAAGDDEPEFADYEDDIVEDVATPTETFHLINDDDGVSPALAPGESLEPDAAWFESLSEAAIPSSSDGLATRLSDPIPDVPPLNRVRPVRPPLIPQKVWIALGAVVAAIALIVVAVVVSANAGLVTVPDVAGVDLGVAKTRLGQIGLEIKVVERRFSTLPQGQVMEQNPEPGVEAKRGSIVELVVSAGTEEVVMPDIIGRVISVARPELEGRGLIVEIETVVSAAASDTVLATFPSAGSVVRTGDRVRVQVATSDPTGGAMKPYQLQGVSVVIDPVPPKSGAKHDPSIDVSRRLRALLEASGARVIELRSAANTSTGESARAARAVAASATVAISLDYSLTGPGGRVVVYEAAPSVPGTTVASSPSAALGSALTSELASVAPPVASAFGADAVVSVASKAWSRVMLGSAADRTDVVSFTDPQWADAIARAIYTAIGRQYKTSATP